MVLDPMNDPITFLGISLALGVVQILFGLCIASGEKSPQGRIPRRGGRSGGWLLLLWGFCFLVSGLRALLSPVLFRWPRE